MSRPKAVVTIGIIAALALAAWLGLGPLGVALAGVIGLALTFGFYWTSRDNPHLVKAASRSPADQDMVAAQPEPDAGLPRHWGWRAACAAFAAAMIVLGFALAA